MFLVDMLSPTTPAKRIETVVQRDRSVPAFPQSRQGRPSHRVFRGRLGVHACYGLPTCRRPHAALMSPRLRPLRYLHSRWDSYPAATTFTGAGLPPAGTSHLCTAHVDQYTTPTFCTFLCEYSSLWDAGRQSRHPHARGGRTGVLFGQTCSRGSCSLEYKGPCLPRRTVIHRFLQCTHSWWHESCAR